MPINIVTISCCVSLTFTSGGAVQGDSKKGNLLYNGQSVPTCQHVFTPFCTCDIYDTYMDECILRSATYISTLNVIISYMQETIVL